MAAPSPTAAPIEWIIQAVTSKLGDTVQKVAVILSAELSDLMMMCFGIYIILIAVNYMRGAAQEPVWDLYIRIVSFAIVIFIFKHVDVYTARIVPIIMDAGKSLGTMIGGGDPDANALDTLAMHYLKIIERDWDYIANLNGWKQVSAWPPFLLKAGLVIAGLVPFLLLSAALIIIAIVGSTLVAAVGPLFFCFLLFPATRQYFSAWVNAVFCFALIPIFVAVICTMAIEISTGLFNGSVKDASFITVFTAVLVNLILILLLSTIQQLASQLSSGGINVGFSAGGVGRMLAPGLRGAGKATEYAGSKTAQGAKWGWQKAKEKLRENGIGAG